MRGFAQRCNQVAVEFYDGQATVFFQQREGDGALARTDFHQHIARFRVDRMHDMLDDAAVGQEVLAKVFLRWRLEMAHAAFP